jgi:autotransporter-associated beta strand protein
VVISNTAVNYAFSGPGKISGLTSLTKQGAGTATLGLANDYAGATTVSAGTMQFGAANATGSADLSVASGAKVDLNGFAGTASALSGSGLVDNTSGTQSTLTFGSGNTSGTWAGVFTNSAAGGVRLIKVGSGTNTFTATNYLAGQNQINGGKLIIPAGAGIAPVGTAEFWIAEGANTATVEINGGFLGGNNWFVVGRNNLAANGTLIVNSGTVQKTGGGNFVVGSLAATGTLIVNGGQVLNNANLWLGERTGAIARLYLNGGLVQATQIRGNDNGGLPTTSEAYFNGGTLQASASSADFIGAPTVAYIQSGGLVFDTQGFVITNAAALTEDGTFPGGGLVKLGTGTLVLSGANGYSGLTVVSNGTLNVDSSISGPATIKSGATLGGNGFIGGVVTVEAGGRLAAGSSIGILYLGATPSLAGSVVAEVDRNGGVPLADQISASGLPLNYGGTLVITNTGAELQVGDTFKLFEASSYNGSFSIVSQTPNQIVTWNTANLTVDGTISVATVAPAVNTTPVPIAFGTTGNTLNLSWPPDHLGWTLQSNVVSVVSSANWYPVAGSASVTNLSLTMDPTKTNVFFRLVYP